MEPFQEKKKKNSTESWGGRTAFTPNPPPIKPIYGLFFISKKTKKNDYIPKKMNSHDPPCKWGLHLSATF